MDDPSADLGSLLDRLKQAQHTLIEDAARRPGLPRPPSSAGLLNSKTPLLRFWPWSKSARAAGNPVRFVPKMGIISHV